MIISLENALGYNNALVTDVNLEPPALAVLLVSLERWRAFLLENLNLERLFFFRVSVGKIDSFPSFICTSFNSIL
jgi:hypothetical protein